MAEPSNRYSPATTLAIQAYLDELAVALVHARAQERDDALSDAAEYFDERLDSSADPDDVALAASELGDPAVFAAGMLSALGRRSSRTASPPEHSGSAPDEASETQWAGRVLGMPFDVRVPTPSRIAARWWDPRNPRIFVPRVFGVGWDVNFGAVAVLLGLIRPDDEEESFATVPDDVFVGALLVPVALTLSVAALAILTRGDTPVVLPIHWDFGGDPDRFWPKSSVVLFHSALAAIPTAYAAYVVAMRQRPLYRAASIGLASMMSALAAGIFLQTVLWGLGIAAPQLMLIVIVVAVCLPLVELTMLARIGRAGEWRRDLDPARGEDE